MLGLFIARPEAGVLHHQTANIARPAFRSTNAARGENFHRFGDEHLADVLDAASRDMRFAHVRPSVYVYFCVHAI